MHVRGGGGIILVIVQLVVVCLYIFDILKKRIDGGACLSVTFSSPTDMSPASSMSPTLS